MRPRRPLGVLVVGTEEPDLKGYRVWLRVVEEYDVALLAESSERAKARARTETAARPRPAAAASCAPQLTSSRLMPA